MRAVIYLFKHHKKINGTLFYCFEYFLCAKEKDPALKFIIHDISDIDLAKVKKIFLEKYVFNHQYLDDVIQVNSLKTLFEMDIKKSLILDVFTFKKIYTFTKSDIICYSNEPHEMIRSEHKKITYYGFYDYQPADHKVRLKLNFDAFKPVTKKDPNNLLISQIKYNNEDIVIPDEIKHLNVLTKNYNSHHENFHELFDTLYYCHGAHDKNNRLIPECFFYQKKIYINYNGAYNDSVYLRYTDISQNGLANYKLDASDLMLQDFLS